MSTEDSITDTTPTEVILDQRYRILRKIGEGGFGVIYEGENLHTGEKVAIKEQKTGDIRRFLREARILHDYADEPNIVTVLDYFEDNEKAYLIMEYLDGKTLAEVIRQEGKWPTEKAVRAFVPVMHALERMHEKGVIHRDISPDNLIVRPDGSLVLMDFGSAKQKNDITVTQGVVFKSIYSPPEQREAGTIARSTTDVYALAATLYFAVTGTEPEDVLSRLLFDELKKPSESGSDILQAAEGILLSGMELRPEDRTKTVQEMREALETVYPDLTEEKISDVLSRIYSSSGQDKLRVLANPEYFIEKLKRYYLPAFRKDCQILEKASRGGLGQIILQYQNQKEIPGDPDKKRIINQMVKQCGFSESDAARAMTLYFEMVGWDGSIHTNGKSPIPRDSMAGPSSPMPISDILRKIYYSADQERLLREPDYFVEQLASYYHPDYKEDARILKKAARSGLGLIMLQYIQQKAIPSAHEVENLSIELCNRCGFSSKDAKRAIYLYGCTLGWRL